MPSSADPDSHARPSAIPQALRMEPPDFDCASLSSSSNSSPFNLPYLTDAHAEMPGGMSYPEQNGQLSHTSEADVDARHDLSDADSASRIAFRTPKLPHDTVADTYMLPRTYLSSSRLNYQFYLWRETLPFPRLLHPCIPLPLPPPWPSPPHWGNQPSSPTLGRTELHPYPSPPPTASSPLAFASEPLRIADVATGTAIWAIQLVRNLPLSASLCGFDISLSQTPPRAWLPPNLELREWDVFTPVPDNCVGKFDVVHVRLLLLVLTPATLRIVVRRLGQMLRDGGWLQWEELDLAHTCLRRAEGEVAATMALPTLECMLRVLQREGDEGWVKGLEDAVRDEGFEDVRLERYWDGVQEARAVFEMHLIKDEEMVRRSNMDEATREAALRRIGDMYNESRRGAVLCSPKLVCVAKKRGQEVANAGVMEGGPVDGGPVDGGPVDEGPLDGEPVDEKLLDGGLADGDVMNGEPMDGELMDEKSMTGEQTGMKTIHEEPADEESTNEEPVNEGLVDGQPMNGELMNEEPMNEEPMNEEPMIEEPMIEEPMIQEPMNEEPMNEEPMNAKLMDGKQADMKPMDGGWEHEAKGHAKFTKTDPEETLIELGLGIADTKTNGDLLQLEVQQTYDPNPMGLELHTMDKWKVEMKERSRWIWHEVFPC